MALTNYLLFLAIFCQISILSLSAKETSGSDDVYQVGIGGRDSELVNPNYLNNVDSLLSNLISESSLGFFNTSTGDVGSNRAYGFYLCRGDLSAKKCNNCLKDVRKYVLDRRPLESYSNGIAFNTDLQCVVHYANNSRSFVYRENTTFTGDGFGDDLAHNQQYNTTLMSTLQELAREAEYGNWTKANFATKVIDVTGSQEKIYVLVQCTPDISAMNCSNCISSLYSSFRPVAIGGRVLGYNCLMKFNNESFFSNGYRNFMASYILMILVLLSTTYIT
ncbi:putative cysteine-rich repeat secretory protein 5 [Chenopodium quinoa]|uniref:putative cysteine-rich repeat secretory protein 5 n=1 Tax=Chenopodium quinoa TaxID=63459 RepID=UPI000B775A20|nr:putative cysteine-rich repeat secretory protein 5 [Chenopodium quinoa]